jgi:HD superfamily phosphohydrolase
MRILETDSEIANVLEKKVRERIIRLLSGEESILHDIISSSLDADKLDYLRRDCYHIGVMYGMFDIYRILHMLDTDEKGDHLVVKEKAKDALENFRIAKYLMHIQVYQHHVRAISDAMFTRAMEIALSERVVDKELLIYKNPKFLAHYFSLDDDSMITRVLDTADANSKARALMYALKNRNLFKRAYSIDLNTVRDELTRQGLAKIDRKQVKEYERKIYDVFKKRVKTTSTKLPEDHIDWLHNIYWDTPDLIILYPQRITNPLYKEPYQTRMERPILIKMDDGPISSLDDVSSITGASQKYIDRIYIFCPDDGKGKEDLTGIRSIIDKIADSLLLSS